MVGWVHVLAVLTRHRQPPFFSDMQLLFAAAPPLPQFTATYRGPEGAPCCACCDVALPLGLFVALVAPVKAAAPCRLTIDTNRDPPPLPDLFYDMVAQVGTFWGAGDRCGQGACTCIA